MTRPRRPSGSRNAPQTSDLASAIDGASSDVTELRDEMEEWQSNLEGNSMEHLPKYDEVTECKDALNTVIDGELDSVEVPEFLSDLTVHYTIDTRRTATSRAARLSNATAPLYGVVEALDGWLEDNDVLEVDEGNEDDEVTEEDANERDSQREAAEELREKIQGYIDDLEGVSFPGMFG